MYLGLPLLDNILASGALGGDPMQSIASNFQFWSDGTTSGSQLTDKSGNGRHATLTSNLITLADYALNATSWVQSGGSAPTTNAMINSDLATGSSTATMRFVWTGATSVGHKSQNFVLKSGDVVTVDFWLKRVTSGAFTFTVRKGDGFNALGSINLSIPGADLIAGSASVGSWGHYRKTFSANDIGGGLACCILTAAGGTYEILMDRDIAVTISGETNQYFIMPQDATLKATDTLNHVYTSAGVSLTTRAAYQYNAYTKKIVCGGAFSYVFLSADPSIATYKILHDNFIKYGNDHAFDSCPINPLTVGSGKTYSTIQAAINVSTTGVPDFRHRRRIELYNDLSVSTYAGYSVVSGGGFMSYIQFSRAYDYVTSVGGRWKITASKELTCTDAQFAQTEVVAPVYVGGWRGIDIDKYYGGYTWHQDFAGMLNSKFIIKDFVFEDMGAQAVYDYRTTNALPAPAGQLTFNVHAGGMHNGFIEVVQNGEFRGNVPYTWQDASTTSGNGGQVYMNDVALDNKQLYDAIANPTSTTLESVRLTSSGGGRSTQIFFMSTTRESTVNKVGAVESIFLTEL